jgi:predicted metal-dependent hydrolase
VWEAEWLAETRPRRLLLQGLIQVAAALYKAARRERPGGCVELLTKGLAKLRRFPEGDEGLALDDFRRGVELALERARAWKEGGPPLDPAHFPRLRATRLKES